jgi:hypothetical protein
MHCLPYPQASDVTPLRAPYIATCTYSLDGQYTFESFYENKISEEIPGLPWESVNATVRTILLLIFRPPSAPFVQAWRFFGLASEALGRDVAHDEFLETALSVLLRPRSIFGSLSGSCRNSGPAGDVFETPSLPMPMSRRRKNSNGVSIWFWLC